MRALDKFTVFAASSKERSKCPHVHHFVYSLPPEGALSSLGAALQESNNGNHRQTRLR